MVADNQQRLLRGLLVLTVLESSVHYADNTVRFDDYTGPNPPAIGAWIAQWMIPVSWVLFTIAGFMGYRRFVQRRWPAAAAWLGAYSVSGLVSLLHYVGIAVSDLTAFQNTFVFLDVAAGSAVLAFAFWVALRLAGRAAPARPAVAQS